MSTRSLNRSASATATPPGLFVDDTSPKLAPAKLTAPLKWHGGKHYLATRIIALMPPHLHYVEPFFGGGSVLLAKDPRGVSEVANDINHELTNFWRVLQNGGAFERFRRQVEAIPFSEVEWLDTLKHVSRRDAVADAVAFFIRCRQSLAGRQDAFSAITRNRTRRGMNAEASAWITAVDGLPQVYQRLRRVVILEWPAIKLLKDHAGPETLFYLDPPYLHETRAATTTYGPHEMSEPQHVCLLDTILHIEGKIMISGYRSQLYDEHLVRWSRRDFNVPNNAAGGARKRRMLECVWCNFQTESRSW